MPVTGKEKELSEKFGAPVEVWLPELMRKHRTLHNVAVVCGVYDGSVRWWLKKIGWKRQAESK
jgi:hypothetical protein